MREYKTVAEWKKVNPKEHAVAKRNGWFDELCKKNGWSSKSTK